MTSGEKMVWAAEYVRKYNEEIMTAHGDESQDARFKRAFENAIDWAHSTVWYLRRQMEDLSAKKTFEHDMTPQQMEMAQEMLNETD